MALALENERPCRRRLHACLKVVFRNCAMDFAVQHEISMAVGDDSMNSRMPWSERQRYLTENGTEVERKVGFADSR
jgi:hypothetical protein